MTEEETRSGPAGAPSASSGLVLRKRADEVAREKGARMPENMEALSSEQARQALHELQVHQIELEMQNEELRGTQAKLEASRARYFDLYDLAPTGYITVSEQGLILEANLTAATLLGVARGALVKQPLSHFIVPEDQDIYYRHRKTLFETGSPQVCEMRLSREDGAQFWARLEATVARDADGAPVWRAVMSDVTEQKRAEAELAEYHNHLQQLVRDRTAKLAAAQEGLLRKERLAALGQLTGSVSHEIRNPLGTIRSSVFSVRERVRGQDAAVDRALDRAERNIQRCDRIIGELLGYARTNRLAPEPTDIDQWLAGVVDEVHIPKTVRLTRKLRCGANVAFDRERMHRCVTNVIENACQAMAWDEGEGEWELVVETCLSDGQVQIRVKDTGVGIPPDELDKVFEPLYSTKTFGVGLGLPIVKQIMEQHGGDVEIESQQGKGTVVTLWLPRGEQEA